MELLLYQERKMKSKELVWFTLQMFIILSIWGMDGDEYGWLRGWR